MNKDLTVGKPSQVLWQFCLPMFGSIIFQQLYNIADSLVAGKFIGENALAAVGNSYEITLIFIAFAFGCNIGCSVIVSRYFGAKEYREMKTSVYTSLIGSAVLCAVLMGIGLFGCDALLELINTPEEILADSALYLDIYVLGLPFMFFYNIATGIFSALGDSKTPFYFLAVSSLSNIGVDILFVAGFKMGIAGVAWATFLCQGVSCVLAMVVVFRRIRAFHTEGHVQLFSWNMLGKVAVVAVPSILQQSFVSVGNIILQSIINTFGASVIAGYSAAVKLNNMVITSFTTLGNGISNYTSQNMGAGKMDRVKEGFGAGRNLVWLLCVPLVLQVGLLGLGCGIIVSSLTTRYRDLMVVVTFGVQLWMYGSPVVYPLSMITHPVLRAVMVINPMTAPMESFRYIFFGTGQVTGVMWASSLVWTVALLALGLSLFSKVEKTFVDTV